jgi:hypothetical protein
MAFRYCCVPVLSNFPKYQIESSNYLGKTKFPAGRLYTCDYLKYYTYVYTIIIIIIIEIQYF